MPKRVARSALAEVRSAVTGIRSTDLAAELASGARLMLGMLAGYIWITSRHRQDCRHTWERGVVAGIARSRHPTSPGMRMRPARRWCSRAKATSLQLVIGDDGRGRRQRGRATGLAGMRTPCA